VKAMAKHEAAETGKVFRVKNKSGGPLTVDLGEDKTLHLEPRGTATLTEAQMGGMYVAALVKAGHLKVITDGGE